MAFLAYFVICVFWGLSSVAVKLGLTHIELFTFSFLRFSITSCILIAYNLLKYKSIRINRSDLKVIFISATLMYFANSIFTTLATKHLDAGLIPIVLSLVPIVMVVLESIIAKKLLVGSIGIVGIIGGVLGIAIISLGGAQLHVDLLGLFYVGCGVMCWASGSMYLRYQRIQTNVTTLLMYQTLTPILYYIIILSFTGGIQFTFDAVSFGSLLYMSIVDTILGSASYVYLLKKWKTSIVSTYAYMNPIVGLIGAYFILGESLTAQKLQGMAVILFSVFLIQSDERLREKLSELRNARKQRLLS